MYRPFLSALGLASVATAAVVSYDWHVTWVNAAPDGFSRPVIGIDNAWPCPKIEATVGDTVIVTIHNMLGNETTGLHFHGINQILTDEMDGPSGVTQCPVPPGSSITYKFIVSQHVPKPRGLQKDKSRERAGHTDKALISRPTHLVLTGVSFITPG